MFIGFKLCMLYDRMISKRIFIYLLADHVSEGMILLIDRKNSGICNFRVQFLDNSVIGNAKMLVRV